MGAEAVERRHADPGHVEECLLGREGAVEVAVIDDAAGERGPDAGELGEFRRPGRVQIDGETEGNERWCVVVDQSPREAADSHVPDRHPGQAAGDDEGERRLDASGNVMGDESRRFG